MSTRKPRIKRAYEAPAEEDGYRILIDRLWPRGISKAHARIDLWLREVAPSTDLRKWFGHRPERWDEFGERYRRELAGNPEPLEQLRSLMRNGPITLVYGAKDEEHNDAVVLLELLSAPRKGRHTGT